MSERTKIQWADATWNPWIGCAKVSAGCAHCYAENTTRARVLRANGRETWGKGAERSRTSEAYWRQPLRWNQFAVCNLCSQLVDRTHRHGTIIPSLRRQRVFPSLCDILDAETPLQWLADFLMLVIDTPNLDWLLLTKRPENAERINRALQIANWGDRDKKALWNLAGLVPHNVWLGTSVENQAMADLRIPRLLAIPARIHFLSVEPLLEGIDLRYGAFTGADPVESQTNIEWVIFGGESGPNARPCSTEWIRDGIRQCQSAGVPVFVKQLGANVFGPNDGANNNMWITRIRDKKGGNMDEWPLGIRVREFPTPKEGMAP
jgi:protein gp37